MCDEVGVGVGNSADDLFEEEPGVLLRDIIILYIVVEFAALGELHNHEDVVGRVQHLVQLDDILVVDEFQDLDLPFHLPRALGTFEIMFLFFILRLFMILTATCTPVMSCRASSLGGEYISPSRTRPCRWSGPGCSVQCALLTS